MRFQTASGTPVSGLLPHVFDKTTVYILLFSTVNRGCHAILIQKASLSYLNVPK